MNKHESDTCQTPVSDALEICVAPGKCAKARMCLVELRRLKKEEDWSGAKLTPCFVSLLRWASIAEKLQ